MNKRIYKVEEDRIWTDATTGRYSRAIEIRKQPVVLFHEPHYRSEFELFAEFARLNAAKNSVRIAIRENGYLVSMKNGDSLVLPAGTEIIGQALVFKDDDIEIQLPIEIFIWED